jgi:hypothetical protein
MHWRLKSYNYGNKCGTDQEPKDRSERGVMKRNKKKKLRRSSGGGREAREMCGSSVKKLF